MSPRYLPVSVFHFWPNLPTLQRGLPAIAERLVLFEEGVYNRWRNVQLYRGISVIVYYRKAF